MKIAILTHFNSFQDGYALAVGWLERARMLEYFGQDFDFLVNETCAEGSYPHQVNCLPGCPTDTPFDKKVRLFRGAYRRILEPYDVILTADLIYQAKGNFLAWNQAMRWANEDFRVRGLKKHWFHWIHSAFLDPDPNAPHPENLRFTPMKDSTLVYMNESEKWGVAKMYGVDASGVACVYNPKDFRSFHGFHPLAWKITKILNVPNKKAVQIFPFCTTRMTAKGIDEVLRVHAALKRQGVPIALVLANSNARKMMFEIGRKDHFAKCLGLTKYDPKDPRDDADYLWTSDLTDCKGPLPRQAVANLFLASNLFVFGSRREVCPNVLLEAQVSGNLLVVNQNLAPAVEFSGPEAIHFPSTAKIPGVADDTSGKSADQIKCILSDAQYDALARKILGSLPSREHLWKYSFEKIWSEQFAPLLYGGAS